jgi:hypothetical protein
VTETIVVD